MLEIRTARLEDLSLLLDWAADEGWNPGLDDALPFYEADPQGFFIGWLDQKPVAAVSVVCSGEGHAFLGFYLCPPDYRGRGYGMALWRHGLAHAGRRTIGLDGVVAQQDNYRKSGFALAWNNVRYGGVLAAPDWDPGNVRSFTPSDLAGLIAYDARHYGAPRPSFLDSWLDGASTRESFVAEAGGQISGYCTLRQCRQGMKIGPLFADGAATAEALLDRVAIQADGAEIYLDVPQVNAAAVSLAEGRGLVPKFETARMYRGAVPELPLDCIFGITTFELG